MARASLLLIVLTLCFEVTHLRVNSMNSDDGSPEQNLFLPAAAEAMQAFREKHGHYPEEWRQLDITFAMYGSYRYEADVRPGQQNKELWQPRGCDYTYKIAAADRDHFRIQALGWDDEPVYEIRDGLKEPKPLSASGLKLTKTNLTAPEPELFLAAAAASMSDYRKKQGTFSREWRQLEIVYSAVPYRPYSKNIRPNENDVDVWRPRGCDFYYRIAEAGKDNYLIQAINNDGQVRFELRDGEIKVKGAR